MIILVSMIIVSHQPAMAFQDGEPFEKIRKKKFWSKVDRQLKKLQRTIEKIDDLDDKRLERRIKRLSKKSHYTISLMSVEEIKKNTAYFKSEKFKTDIKEEIRNEISSYRSFDHFYEHTMNGANRTLCMFVKIGIWTTAPILYVSSVGTMLPLAIVAGSIDPSFGYTILWASIAGLFPSYNPVLLIKKYKCLK